MTRSVLVLLLISACPTALLARTPAMPDEGDKFHVTEVEKAACGQDALALCSSTFPSEDRLLLCMKAKKMQLTPICLTTFEAGLRRRHLSTD